MKSTEKLSYSELYAFLQGQKDLDKLAELQKNMAVYGIFGLMKKSMAIHSTYPAERNLTFNKAEEYLEKYLTGNLKMSEATQLSEAILSSERNFTILNHVIEQHSAILASYNEQSKYDDAISNSEILQQLRKFKDKNPKHSYNSYIKKIVAGLISIAALFFILLMLPIQINNSLDDLYSYDNNVPLDYKDSTLRGTLPAEEVSDPDYRKFKFQFYKGMSEYLAQEYANALSEWEGLEDKLTALKNNSFFNEKDRRDFILYNAVCRIALYLSENEKPDESEREKLLNKAIELFKKLPVNSDAEKYYYALALGLKKNNSKALTVLSSITSNSEYFRKKIILEEQLR
jgi:hypothetical protein